MSATVTDDLPKIDNLRTTSDSFDEKGSLKEKDGALATDVYDAAVVGDVYEDVRAIDLGDNGKERPIGT